MGPGSEIDEVGRVPDPLWRRLVANPERAPELVAMSASERFAGPAEEWARTHHGSRPDARASKAYRKHVRLARVEGLALGVGGALTGAGNVAGLAWIQARMVFFIAASHGYDPRDPMRPAELLALWGVYETPQEARESLDGTGASMAETVVRTKMSKSQERSVANRLMRYVGKRAATRYGGRLIPLLGAPISAVQNGGSTKDLGRRALAYYGGDSAPRR